MAKDQFEFLGGGVLRDRYGRREMVVSEKHAAVATGDIATAGDLSDGDGREQIVLQNPNGTPFTGSGGGTVIVNGGNALPRAVPVTNAFVDPRATTPANFTASAPSGSVTQNPTSRVDGFQQPGTKSCQEVIGTPGGGFVALRTAIKAAGHPVAPLSQSYPMLAARFAGKVVAAGGTVWYAALAEVYYDVSNAKLGEVIIWSGKPALGAWFVAEGFDSQAPPTTTYAELELRVYGSTTAVTLRGTEIVHAIDPEGDVPYYVGGDLNVAGAFSATGISGAWLGAANNSASVGMFDPAGVYPAQPFGFNDFNAYADSMDPAQAAEMMLATGCTLDRALGTVLVKSTSLGPTITIADIEPAGLNYMKTLIAAGLKVTINPGAAPWMMASVGDGWPSTAPGRAQFVAMVLAVIADLGVANVTAVQLGNEPNNPAFNPNAQTAASYAAHVTAVKTALTANYPTVKVAAGVLSMGGTGANASAFTWLDGMYAANAQYDWLDVHPYPMASTTLTYGSSGPLISGGTASFGLDLGFDTTMKQIRDYLATKSDSTRPLFISEIGVLSAGSERLHSQVLALCCGRLRRDSQVAALTVHTLVSAVNQSTATTVDAGVFDPKTLRPRPAAYNLALLNGVYLAPPFVETIKHDPSINAAAAPGAVIANRGQPQQAALQTVFNSPSLVLGGGSSPYLMVGQADGTGLSAPLFLSGNNQVLLTCKGTAGQTASLAEFRNSANTLIASVSAAGGLFGQSLVCAGVATVGALTGFGAQVNVTVGVATTPGIILRGAAAQSADLLDLETSAGTILTRVSNIGLIQTASDVTADTGLASQVTIGNAFGAAAVILGSAGDTFLLRTAAGEITTNRVIMQAAASVTPVVARGAAAQTAQVFQVQNSATGVLFAISAGGIPQWSSAANVTNIATTGGSASVLPAQPVEYFKVTNSTNDIRLIPSYAP